MFEINKDFELEAVASGRPGWILPSPAPRCNLAIRKDTGDWFVATGAYYKHLESIDGTVFMDSDGCTWRLLRTTLTPSPEVSRNNRHEHWRVSVETTGEHIVSIEPGMLAGREISYADEHAIRTAAHHLLAFIGDPVPETESMHLPHKES